MKAYRVRWAEYYDDHCAQVTAESPQGAAECFVECSSREMEDGEEFEVVVIDGRRRHNVVVRASLSWSFEARKPRDLQKERW